MNVNVFYGCYTNRGIVSWLFPACGVPSKLDGVVLANLYFCNFSVLVTEWLGMVVTEMVELAESSLAL